MTFKSELFKKFLTLYFSVKKKVAPSITFCRYNLYIYNSGQKPLDSNSGQKPLDSNSGQNPVDSNTGQKPLDYNTGQKPLDSNSGQKPLDSKCYFSMVLRKPDMTLSAAVPGGSLPSTTACSRCRVASFLSDRINAISLSST